MIAGLTLLTATVARTVRSALDHDARRLRRVERDPRIATEADIESLVRAHGVSEDRVWVVVDRIEAAELEAPLVWSWTMQFDGVELAELCGSGLNHVEVRECLIARTAADDLVPGMVTRSA